MPHNQNIGDKSICCVSCGKVIAKGHISTGKIEIKCKCGVVNKIEAEKKPEGRERPGVRTVEEILQDIRRHPDVGNASTKTRA